MKPSEFYVGVLDFFGALLPGAVTLAGAIFLNIPSGLPGQMRATVNDSTALGVFFVVAYVVGQIANGIGSTVLDSIYDLLYAPGKGVLALWKKNAKPTNLALTALFSFFDYGTGERREALENALVKEGVTIGGGVYQMVRAFLRVRMPDAFAEVEKIEGEQKFFRALTVGAATLAIALNWLPPNQKDPVISAPWLWGFTVLFLVRYMAIRRKTVERAYTYFNVRAAAVEANAKKEKDE